MYTTRPSYRRVDGARRSLYHTDRIKRVVKANAKTILFIAFLSFPVDILVSDDNSDTCNVQLQQNYSKNHINIASCISFGDDTMAS